MMSNVAQYYKDNVGLVHTVAKKGWARLQAVGVSMDYDDVFQEVTIAFLKAYESFDETKGFKFSTLFFTCAYNRLNGWVQDLIAERVAHGVRSIEELNSGDGESLSLEDVIMADSNTPEAEYAAKQFLEHLDRRLSSVAKLIIEWIIQPPQELVEELRAAQAKADYGRELGLATRCFMQISPRTVATFVVMVSDVTESQAAAALRELKNFESQEVRKFFVRG